jgi:hypothetical protein
MIGRREAKSDYDARMINYESYDTKSLLALLDSLPVLLILLPKRMLFLQSSSA